MLVKRSLSISGHRTSLALEAEFWAALGYAASEERKPMARIVADIDKLREANNEKSGLASAVRVWLFHRYCTKPSALKGADMGQGSQWCQECDAPHDECPDPHVDRIQP
jgi:predicted DNA-binding ribbon-helix-helix protein